MGPEGAPRGVREEQVDEFRRRESAFAQMAAETPDPTLRRPLEAAADEASARAEFGNYLARKSVEAKLENKDLHPDLARLEKMMGDGTPVIIRASSYARDGKTRIGTVDKVSLDGHYVGVEFIEDGKVKEKNGIEADEFLRWQGEAIPEVQSDGETKQQLIALLRERAASDPKILEAIKGVNENGYHSSFYDGLVLAVKSLRIPDKMIDEMLGDAVEEYLRESAAEKSKTTRHTEQDIQAQL